MNLVFLASFLTFILVIFFIMKSQQKKTRDQEAEFWSREERANSVRRKPLDDLNYIKIPLEAFPTHLLNDNDEVLECIDILESLTSLKIVNFTGRSNTDLKLEYGTANLEVLTEYDQNYTVLVRTLQKWADRLIENDYKKEAVPLMEFAVSTGTDISRTYYILAEYYASLGQYQEIDRLRTVAKNLLSANRNVIVRHLQESYPDVF
ncbi:MAG: hypothetical protein K2J60_06665 [Acetatifactor sp.]|nr:hypothetical protein [Acetatifactor sp.]